MESIFKIKNLKSLPSDVQVVFVGTFLTRTAYFMVWPYMSVLFYRKFGISATYIGGILTCATMLGAITGIYSGYFSDKFGRRWMIVLGAGVGTAAFFLMAYATSIEFYLISISLVSIGNSAMESASRALIGDRIDDKRLREFCFYARYLTINVGVSCGAVLGVLLGLSGGNLAFLFTSAIYLGYFALLLVKLPSVGSTKNPVRKKEIGFSTTCLTIFTSKTFLILLLSNTATVFVYAHFNSTLIQFMTRSGAPDLMTRISILVTINAITVIFGQFPLMRLLERFEPISRIILGVSLIGIAQLFFAYSPIHLIGVWILATIILSIGELVSLPTFGVEVDRSTPNGLRGTYFGASNLYNLGYAFAPVVGGLSLDHIGGSTFYTLLSLICLAVVLVNRNFYKRVEVAKTM
ncbi:MAG: MFS transporter [Herbaspirillum sp.]